MKTPTLTRPKKPFDSKGAEPLAPNTFVQTKYGERGWIDGNWSSRVPDQWGQYSVITRYGRGSNQIRTRDQMRPINRDEFIAYHRAHGNTGMLCDMP